MLQKCTNTHTHKDIHTQSLTSRNKVPHSDLIKKKDSQQNTVERPRNLHAHVSAAGRIKESDV